MCLRLRALEWTRGEYWARADELSIVGESAKTERGAIKKLREAVELRFKRAAADGTLCDLLDKAGYKGLWIALPSSKSPVEFGSRAVWSCLCRCRARNGKTDGMMLRRFFL